MAENESDLDLTAAYSLVTPEDSRQLYAKWAKTYDEDFITTHGYVYDTAVAQLFARYASAGGSILDVGCGTGAVGVALAAQGLGDDIHGIDISPEMLDVAATKTQANGQPVYSALSPADLTKKLDLPTNHFGGGVISAGAYTHGHLGPETLDEVLRVAAPGSTAAIGVNSAHYIAKGFGDYFDAQATANKISRVEIVEAQIYDASIATAEDKSELDAIAYVAMFIVRA